jgi:hypothetical protein
MERHNPAPEHTGSIVRAIALLIVGLVVFVPSGLCTGFFFFTPFVQAFEHPRQGNNEFGLSGIALIVGGPFVAGGISILWYGAKEMIAYFRR